VTFVVIGSASPADAHIFQWEYINPADPSQGKRQSTTLTPDGAGVDAVPSANLANRDLTMAYLIGADLTGANGSWAILTNADLSHANLTNANFSVATLTDADFTNAQVQGADFSYMGLALAQLYSTASYKARDLTGIHLGGDVSGADFAGQNLTNASFSSTSCNDFGQCSTFSATLTDADFRLANVTNVVFFAASLTDADFAGAEIRGADFGILYLEGTPGRTRGSGITLSQLYSTESYQAHDLSGVRFDLNVLSGGNFAGHNLANASFLGATLADADLTDADVRGANFSRNPNCYFVCEYVGGITFSQLYSTASYQAHDLSGIGLGFNDLTGGNFVEQNLANANFYGATVTDADFSGAEVRGANFDRSIVGTGITLAQLYSTASYQAHDLSGINLSGNYLSGGNFAGQNLANAIFWAATLTDTDFSEANLTNAYFTSSTLAGADFTAADARGAQLYIDYLPADTITRNLIRPNGHIHGLDLNAGGRLVVRDHDGYYGITVDQHLTIGPGGKLRMVFEADAWDSTISFAPGIPVTLGGTLELTFADDGNLASQVGRTLKIFDWTGVNPAGAFNVSSPYTWNLSNLYTTGEVTLTAIPEPATFMLAVAGLVGTALFAPRRSE
jgi:uncharacterized protein YjbI with pentapeptide repeats